MLKGNYAHISYDLNIVLAAAVSGHCERSQLRHRSGLGISGQGLSPTSSAQCVPKCQHVPPGQERVLTKIGGEKGQHISLATGPWKPLWRCVRVQQHIHIPALASCGGIVGQMWENKPCCSKKF